MIFKNLFKFTDFGTLAYRNSTKYIILHHVAGNSDPVSINKQHKAKNWSCIGYHFFIDRFGIVFPCRPIYSIGAHCKGYNSNSIGIVLNGNFEKDFPTSESISSLKELILYLSSIYPGVQIKKHSDLMATQCPGRNFPNDLL